MGPGFDVEVFIEGKGYVTTEGTSFSCPFIAAIALLVYHVCGDAEILDDILVYASEGLTDGKCVQPTEGENYHITKSKVMGYGYGAIDAYDAIWLAVNKLLSWFHLYCPSTVSGMQTISVYCDFYGFIMPYGQIQKVEFYINGDKEWTDTSQGRYEYAWDTSAYIGQVVVKAIIYDHYGNTRIRTVNVYVNPGGGGGGGGGSFW
jgi:hypothetical protein